MKDRIIWMLGGAALTVVVFVLAQQFLFGTTSAEQISQEEAEQIVLDAYSGDIEEVNEEREHFTVKVKLPSGSYTVFVNKESGELEDLKAESNGSNNEETGKDDHNEEELSEEKNEEETPDEEVEATDDKQKDQEVQSLLTKDDILNQIEDEFDGEVLSVKFYEEEIPYYGVKIEEDNEFIYLMVGAENGEVINQQVELKTQTPISEEEAVNIAFNKHSGEIDDIEYKEINGTLYYIVEIDADDDQDLVVRIHAITGEAIVIWDDDTEDQSNDEQEEN